MSSPQPDSHVDLIDFHESSPVLPRRSSISEIKIGEDSENLIDTELPIFEQKLQNAANTISCHSRRNSVDVEDILIKIDSDEYETDSLDGQPVETERFFDVCDGITTEDSINDESSLPVDNFEALLVLRNLDELLNATLAEYSIDENLNLAHRGQGEEYEHEEVEVQNEENAQQIIEECLEDLDNYLKAIEDDDVESQVSSSCDISEDTSATRDDSISQDLAGSSSINGEHEDNPMEFNEENERQKLRKIESNYNKFVSSGIVNLGYVDTENNTDFILNEQLRRPSSACAMASQVWNRKHPFRATTLAAIRKERPMLYKTAKRRKSLSDNNTVLHCTLPRTSGTDAYCNTPENWLASSDVTRERHAHASNDCCSGTVIVEPLRRQSKADSSSVPAVHEVANAASPKEDRSSPRGSWLRSSMRRLQRLSLPNADCVDDESVAAGEEGGAVRLEILNNARPLSAPSRLPPSEASTERTSRSRSRESVSHEPNGRARSSSESSRSRRPRSLSSSVTSLDSSAESTLSHMPPTESGRSNAATNSNRTTSANGAAEAATNGTNRRYSFLITGIIYGALKLQALKALEESRTEEKARKKAERAIRLREEKRLAAVRDFNQIVEIFTPPPKVESVGDIGLQDYCQSTKGLNAENVDSDHKTLFGNGTNSDFSSKIDSKTQETYDSSPESKFYDRPLDFSVDDFTKSYGEMGDEGDNTDRFGNETSETDDTCEVKVPKNVDGNGYIITDYGAIPVLPPEEENPFKPDK